MPLAPSMAKYETKERNPLKLKVGNTDHWSLLRVKADWMLARGHMRKAEALVRRKKQEEMERQRLLWLQQQSLRARMHNPPPPPPPPQPKSTTGDLQPAPGCRVLPFVWSEDRVKCLQGQSFKGFVRDSLGHPLPGELGQSNPQWRRRHVYPANIFHEHALDRFMYWPFKDRTLKLSYHKKVRKEDLAGTVYDLHSRRISPLENLDRVV